MIFYSFIFIFVVLVSSLIRKIRLVLRYNQVYYLIRDFYLFRQCSLYLFDNDDDNKSDDDDDEVVIY